MSQQYAWTSSPPSIYMYYYLCGRSTNRREQQRLWISLGHRCTQNKCQNARLLVIVYRVETAVNAAYDAGL